MGIIKLVNIGARWIRRRASVVCRRNWDILFIPPFLLVGFYFLLTPSGGYPGKRYQSEAKLALARVYAFQRDHFNTFSRYSLDPAEWKVETENGSSRYIIGIALACAPKINQQKLFYLARFGASDRLIARLPEAVSFLANARKPEDCRDPSKGFEAFAVGEIAEGKPLDVWVIDESKEIRNFQHGF